MLKPRPEKNSGNLAQKFVRIFSLLMTLLYVGLGFFLMVVDKEKLNLGISNEVKLVLGGILILYGAARFVRVYQLNKRSKNTRDED